MSGINWTKHNDRQRMARHGVEDRVDTRSKDALRREADRLLAGYTGLVTKLPVGVTGEIPCEPARPARQKQKRRDRGASHSGSRQPRSPVIRSQVSTAVPPGLVIYCDGACEPNPGIGGWGFVVYRDGVEIHSDCGGLPTTTNNIMEMTGALMALRWFAERGIVDPVRLLCDSMYVVNGCNEWRHSWKARGWKRKGKNPEIANLALWQELDRLLTIVPINLQWCKGHAGIIGNERADELSLMGREQALSAPAPVIYDSAYRLEQIKQQLEMF